MESLVEFAVRRHTLGKGRALLAALCAQLFAPRVFAGFFFGEELFERRKADEPHAAGETPCVHQAFTAPTAEAVG